MSPRSDEENQRIRDERREQILIAAARVFSRKGLAATKITEVAALAGVSHGLLYHYFPSKEDLFAALVERAMTGSAWVAQNALAQPGTPADKLRFMLMLMLGGVQQQPDLFMVMVQVLTSDAVPHPVREMAIQQGAIVRSAAVQLITEGQAAGQFMPGDPDQLAIALLAIINGLAVGMGADPALLPNFPSADLLLEMIKRK